MSQWQEYETLDHNISTIEEQRAVIIFCHSIYSLQKTCTAKLGVPNLNKHNQDNIPWACPETHLLGDPTHQVENYH